ncbi:MAG: nitroreductase family protein [Pseudomonadota bacterium]
MATSPPDPNPLDLHSVDALLSTTRSVRRKLDFDRVVEPELLYQCIDLATQAPMGIGGESWRFLIVTEPERKRAVADLYRDVIEGFEAAGRLQIKDTQRALIARLPDMPAMIFVYINAPAPGAEVAAQVGFYGSILPVAWSLMLALRSRGLGTTWTSLLASRQAELAQLLDAPPDSTLTVMFPVAHMKGAVLKATSRQPAEAVTFWNSWGEAGPDVR